VSKVCGPEMSLSILLLLSLVPGKGRVDRPGPLLPRAVSTHEEEHPGAWLSNPNSASNLLCVLVKLLSFSES
jgi:hypothetical protein